MAEGSLRITEKTVNKLKASLSDMIQRYQTETVLFGVRFVAGIVGQVISTQEVFGDQARLRTRYSYECVLGRVSWNSKVMVSHEAFRECKFWVNNIHMLNEIGTQLCHLTYSEAHDFHIFCDASETGFGGHLTTGSEDEPVETYGSWSYDEKVQSSTWRELEAVNRTMRSVIGYLNGKVVRVYTDNKNVPHILRVGSRKIILHEKVMSVHKLCLQNSLKINAVWILRESNDKTDNLSRKSDCDDWEIENFIVKYLG
jgi:hypothetical protein